MGHTDKKVEYVYMGDEKVETFIHKLLVLACEGVYELFKSTVY